MSDNNEGREFNIHDIVEPNTDAIAFGAPSTSYVSEASPITNFSIRKYVLSKKAYMLVLHHYMFDNPAHYRPGSQQDMQRIEHFNRNYRIQYEKHENKTAARVHEIMDGIVRNDFNDYSCLITIIMSHGLQNDQILARDGRVYSFEEDIVEKCTSNPTLHSKPKVFIVQACRGRSEMERDSIRMTRSKKNDVLIFQSTYTGFFSYRDPQNGTFFIQNFLELLDQYRDEDICHLNKHLIQVFEQKRLVCEYESCYCATQLGACCNVCFQNSTNSHHGQRPQSGFDLWRPTQSLKLCDLDK
ncbi:caspase-14-like isoform X2 [Anopheles albimanus]|nr:caspase-14-like isoform X2 [Anopheles albimanus]